jgi:intein-encoded DNA endonuclease-like protein
MFYKINDWKNFLLDYLSDRRKKLNTESKQFTNIEEAYRAGFLRGFWEGAGESFGHTEKRVT